MSTPRISLGPRRRRRLDVVVLVLVALVVGFATTVVASVTGGERVARLWVTARIGDDGSAQVLEVVDYDFGVNDRHGILRTVPQLRRSATVEVSSPDAPADVSVDMTSSTARIRIGDPSRTVSGRHRYVLRYTVDGVVVGGRLAWDAVGTGWDAPMDDVEVHLVAPTALDGPRCTAGATGSTAACPVREAEPGSLVAAVSGLSGHEGVTVYATAGAALGATPALPAPPAAAPAPPGTDPLVVGGLAAALALLVALVGSRWIRRAGRERVPTVGLPVTAPPGEEARIDLSELARYATPSPSLPDGLPPPQGGILLADGVLDRHKAAWLIAQAVAGTIGLEPGDGGPKDLTLVRLQPGEGSARRVLDLAFRGHDRVPLGSYDKDFATAWNAIGAELSAWRRISELWDHDADRRTTRVRILGVLAALAGVALAVLGGYLAARQTALPLVLAGVGGVLTGAGASAALRGWELRVLTPQGSAAWLRVESLRQFLAQSPPTAVDQAIASGRLGEYTAWALALGQAERWSQLASSVSVPGRAPVYDPSLRYAMYGPVFLTGCHSASVAPSSSGGGGGSFGGGVGGGAGGGGGGSW